MKRLISVLFLLAVLLCGCEKVPAETETTEKTKYSDYSFDFFDTVTTIVGYEKTEEEFKAVCEDIKSLMKEYHQLYTVYNRYDGVENLCTLNRTASEGAVKVDEKIIGMLSFSKEMYELTGGRTNIAMGSVLSIWHDHREAGMNDPVSAELPDMRDLQEAAKHTDINDLVIDIDNNTVFYNDPELKVDVGAVAKGYAVEAVAQWLESEGKNGYILNVGGNVRAVGAKGDGTPWTVGIENPDTEDEAEPYIAYLSLENMAVVTSGSYQRYYVVDGVEYHHIIDPETLMPGEKFRSVSVICKDSGLGDALSTSLFLMTYEEGLQLVDSLEDVEAMWVTHDGEQLYSSGFESFFVK